MVRLFLVALVGLLPSAALAVDFDYTCPENVKVGPLEVTYELDCFLTNNEGVSHDFRVLKTQDLPSGNWTASICVNGLCYSPSLDSLPFPVTVGPGETDTVSVWFSTSVDEGGGRAWLTVKPEANPSEGQTMEVAAISNGVEALIVDDDGGETYESYYIEAIPSGVVFGVWPTIDDGQGNPSYPDMSDFDFIIWLTGEHTPTLTADDRTAISTLLDNGGKLCINGQDIAYAMCDPGSPEFSASACAFVNNYLNAAYLGNNSGSTDVKGVPGSIGSGLDFSIAGGAGNQNSPDGIEPWTGPDGDWSWLYYDGTAYQAAVHDHDGDMRMLFGSFGLEGITMESTRDDYMTRVFDYFNATVDVDLADGAVPSRFGLSQNRPNPFNPTTTFFVKMDREGHATVTIHDASGRLVRTLLNRTVPSGETSLTWDGSDDDGRPVASGVYFANLKAGDLKETRKVTLVR